MSKLLLVCFLCFFYLYGKSSLNYEIGSKEKADYYWMMSDSMSLIDMDSCMYYTKLAGQEYNKIKDHSNFIKAKNAEASILLYQDDFIGFWNLQDSITPLAFEILNSSDPVLFSVVTNQSVLYRMMGRYDEAIALTLEYVSQNETAETYIKANALLNLAFIFSKKGAYSESIDMANRALDIRKKIYGETSKNLISPLTSLSRVYRAIANFTMAIQYNNEALLILKRDKDSVLNINLLLDNIAIRLDAKEYFKAKVVFNQLAKKKLMGRYFARYKSLYAKYLLATNETPNFKLIEMLLLESNQLYIESGIKTASDQKYLDNILLLSDFYDENLEVEKRYSLLNASLDSLSLGNFEVEKLNNTNVLFGLKIAEDIFDVEFSRGNYNKSTEAILFVYSALNKLRDRNSNATNLQYWNQENLRLIEKGIQYFTSRQMYDEAFMFAEDNKSNLLLKDILNLQARDYAGIPNELLQEEKVLLKELSFIDKKLDVKSIPQEQRTNLIALSTQKDLELKRVSSEIGKLSSSYHTILNENSSDVLKGLQADLDHETYFVEYFVGIDSTYAFYVTKNDCTVSNLGSSDELDQKLRKYYTSISNYIQGNENEGNIPNVANLLLSPKAKEDLKQFKKMTLVADGFLLNIPFETLSFSDNDYLVNDMVIDYQYSYNLSKAITKERSEEYDNYFTGFFYDTGATEYLAQRSCVDAFNLGLFCGKEELSGISDLLSSDISTFITDKYTELITKLGSSKIIHLTTHACFDKESFGESKIYFDDHFLSASDIKAKKINSELVVLSACETGYGNIEQGEGSMTLAKSFFHAGTKSTLVSLWPVDDCSTKELMFYFYKNLMSGVTKSEALSKAKNDYMTNAHYKRKHPYYWSGFILIGDNSPLFIKSSGFSLFNIISAAFLFVLLLVLFLKFRK